MSRPPTKQPVYHPQPALPLRHQLAGYGRLLRPRGRPAHVVSFVIFAQGRTGSTLLVDLLRSHPDVHCDEEILWRRVIAPVAWAECHRRQHPSQHYGFKVKPYQLTEDQHTDPHEFLTRMDRRGWKVIHLWRRNVLRHALSNMVADHVGRFVTRGGSAAPPRDLVVDVDMLLGAMQLRTDLAGAERDALAGIPHVSVCYEDDLLDASRHQHTLDRLSDQLGLPRADAHTDVRRMTEKNLRDMISNYDDVVAAVSKTQWADLLDD